MNAAQDVDVEEAPHEFGPRVRCAGPVEANVIEVNETVVLRLPLRYSKGILMLVQGYTYFDGRGKAWGTARSEALVVLGD